jgi:general secretion pathway protein F
MTTFTFRGVTADNQSVTGTVDADDPIAAARQIIERGLYPTDITRGSRRLEALLKMQIGGRALSDAELGQFLGDLGHLLEAGIELATALSVLASPVSAPRTRNLAASLLTDVRAGCHLSQALRQSSLVIPAHVITLANASEASGTLGKGLCIASDALRRSATLRAQLLTALIYPLFVAIALIFALLVLIGVVVPAIEGMFAGNASRLPWQTQVLIATSHGLRGHTAFVVILFLGFAIAATALVRNTRVRQQLELLALRVPGLGGLLRTAETARISNLLALMHSSGVPLASTLELCQSGGRMCVSQASLSEAAVKIREGSSLASALMRVPTILPRTLALIDIGEATGRLGPMLQEAASDTERRMSVAIERFLALLTPALTLVFGAVIGFVLYAVMTSILSINNFAMT